MKGKATTSIRNHFCSSSLLCFTFTAGEDVAGVGVGWWVINEEQRSSHMAGT
jgi:hypothetical protein